MLLRKPIVGKTDLLTVYPEIEKEWDYEKNYPLTPQDVFPKAGIKVYWKCEKGHSYDRTIVSKTQKSKDCPYCTGKRVLEGVTDLFSIYPKLKKDWDFEKNEIDPTTLLPMSSLKVFWKCKEGHSYDMRIVERTYKGRGCPFCSNRRVLKGFNALATTHPDIAKEWHPIKNLPMTANDLTYGSEKKVYWLCENGHTFKQSPNERTSVNARTCPECSKGSGTSYAEKFIYICMKELFTDTVSRVKLDGVEYDVYIPSLNFGIEYDGHRYHTKIKDALKDEVAKETGILLFRVKEVVKTKLDKVKINGHIIEYTPIPGGLRNRKNLICIVEKLVQFIETAYNLECDFKVPDDIHNMVLDEVLNYKKEVSIAVKFPHLLQYWDYEKNSPIVPERVAAFSNIPYWWRCEKGHSVMTSPNSKTKAKFCPVCINKQVLAGYNDLETTIPEILVDWAYDLNEIKPNEISKGSGKKVYWRCHSCNEVWQSSVVERIKRGYLGCQKCKTPINK